MVRMRIKKYQQLLAISRDQSAGETKEKVAPGMGNLEVKTTHEPSPAFISSDEEDVLPF